MMKFSLPAALILLMLTGCAAFNETPRAAVVHADRLGLSTNQNPPISPQWWQQAHDPKLNALIEQTLANSPDLAAAEARFKQAEAAAGLADSQRGIQAALGLSGAWAKHKSLNDTDSPILKAVEDRYLGSNGTEIQYGSANLQGKWALDLWGRYRHQTEAALGRQRAVAYEIAQTKLLLAQGVAGYYRQWQLLLAQKQLLQQRLTLNREREKIVGELIRAGQVAPSQLYAVLQGTQRFQTALSDLDGNIAQLRHALAALSGQPANALDHFNPNPLGAVPLAPTMRLSADLIGKRPDIAAQREGLNARAALIKSAKAQFYPDVSIKALVGLSDLEIGNLPHSSSFLGAVLPSISLPIFTSGALQANLSQKEAEFDEQAARYNKSVYSALREAADALVQYETAQEAVKNQQNMLSLGQKNAAAAHSLYRTGMANKLAWLDAQDENVQLQAQLSQLQTQQYAAWLALNTAFGGGFEAGTPNEPAR